MSRDEEKPKDQVGMPSPETKGSPPPVPGAGVGSTIRQYASTDGELKLRLRGLETDAPVRLHLEHTSGAALIVPACDRRKLPTGHELWTCGFDGTEYRFTVEEATRVARIVASAPSSLLGGRREIYLNRGDDLVIAPTVKVRISGDEDTMPITVKKL